LTTDTIVAIEFNHIIPDYIGFSSKDTHFFVKDFTSVLDFITNHFSKNNNGEKSSSRKGTRCKSGNFSHGS